jgi:hypothetical protein
MHRREFLTTSIALLLASPFGRAASFTKGREVAPMPKQLKPGDYVWHPEISPAGPVVIIVSIPDQQLFVFRNVPISLSLARLTLTGSLAASIISIRQMLSKLYLQSPEIALQNCARGVSSGAVSNHNCSTILTWEAVRAS